MRPHTEAILCCVTDRRGFSVAKLAADDWAGAGDDSHSIEALRDFIEKIAAAGVDWIQIREKDLEAQQLRGLASAAVEMARATRTRIIVNDRLDVALAARAAGVHLGENSLPVAAVASWKRAASQSDAHASISADFLIGASCHSLESAIQAEGEGADYIFFGPVFATPSKAVFGAPQGLTRLKQVCHAVRVPVLAIGGVTLENAAACLDAGAAGIAAIRLFQEARDPAALVARYRAISSGSPQSA